jgi:uncharacterized membrane protein (DUF441 family)
MRMMGTLPRRDIPLISWQVLAAIALLCLTFSWSILGTEPVRSIAPYGLATALVSWRHGVSWGFVAAAVACIIALAGGALPTRPERSDEPLLQGMVTFLKLSAVAVGVVAGKIAGRRMRASFESDRRG